MTACLPPQQICPFTFWPGVPEAQALLLILPSSPSPVLASIDERLVARVCRSSQPVVGRVSPGKRLSSCHMLTAYLVPWVLTGSRGMAKCNKQGTSCSSSCEMDKPFVALGILQCLLWNVVTLTSLVYRKHYQWWVKTSPCSSAPTDRLTLQSRRWQPRPPVNMGRRQRWVHVFPSKTGYLSLQLESPSRWSVTQTRLMGQGNKASVTMAQVHFFLWWV